MNDKINEVEVKEIQEIQDLNNYEILDLKTNVEGINKFISSIEIETDVEGIKEQRKKLNDLKKVVSEKRKSYYANLKEEEKTIMTIEKTINEIIEQTKEKEEELLKEIKIQKYKSCVEFYETQKKDYDIFDFIDFKEHIYEETMVNSNIYTSKGDALVKKIKDIITNKLIKFQNDKVAIGDDGLVLTEYKRNGFDFAGAKLYVDKMKQEQAKIEVEKELKEQTRQKLLDEQAKEIKKEEEIKVQESVKISSDVNDASSNSVSNDTTEIIVSIPNEKLENFVSMLNKNGIAYRKGDNNE